MERYTMEPKSSLGDRAVLVAGVLAIVLVWLFGAEPRPAAEQVAQTAQAAQR
jgi:hypothetical protein